MFTLATINQQGSPLPVIETGGRYWRLADVAPELLQPEPRRGLLNIFGNWSVAEPILVALASALAGGKASAAPIGTPTSDQFSAPLQYPSKLLCAGANYYEHLRLDAGITDFRKEDNVPPFFMKPPTTALVGSGKTVRVPSQTEKLDYEVELIAVIGSGGRKISEEDALDHVAGYTIGLDMSAREWQFHHKHLFKADLFGGKAFDDSCPAGPRIVPARFVDPQNLHLRLWVNGELRQDASTADMIWSVAELVSAISTHTTLEPGDMLMTGSPAGVGLPTGRYLKIGDVVEAEMPEIGRLTVELVEDADRQSTTYASSAFAAGKVGMPDRGR
jgi:2-keto-4-pentenoate hydratase/2-oxohepta-3-ene-1,7-dioic acid hydratase in catechol pathway